MRRVYYSCSYPKRRSCRSLLRQSSLTLTKSCRKTFLPRKLLHVLASGLSHALELLALVADENALLRFAGDVDRRGDAVDRRLLAVALDLNLAAVGDLLVVEAQDLLADDLRGEEAQRLVRERILGIVGGAFGQQLQNRLEEPFEVEALAGRDRHDARRGELRLPLLDQRVEPCRVREVDLVDDDDGRDAALAYLSDDFGRAVALLDGVGDVEDDVGVRHGPRDELHHRLLQLVGGFENARRVGVDNLELLAGDDAHDAVARGLRLGGDDREPLADERVHEGRFPDIGIPDDIDKARFVHFP